MSSGHRVTQVNPVVYINQNDIVLVKKNSQWVATGFLTRPVNLSGHPNFLLLLFFLKFGPVPTPGQPGPESTCRVGPDFKTILIMSWYSRRL